DARRLVMGFRTDWPAAGAAAEFFGWHRNGRHPYRHGDSSPEALCVRRTRAGHGGRRGGCGWHIGGPRAHRRTGTAFALHRAHARSVARSRALPAELLVTLAECLGAW